MTLTPLWKLFPDRDPFEILTATQGQEEAALEAWKIGWLGLSSKERETYLATQNPSPAWKSAILNITRRWLIED